MLAKLYILLKESRYGIMMQMIIQLIYMLYLYIKLFYYKIKFFLTLFFKKIITAANIRVVILYILIYLQSTVRWISKWITLFFNYNLQFYVLFLSLLSRIKKLFIGIYLILSDINIIQYLYKLLPTKKHIYITFYVPLFIYIFNYCLFYIKLFCLLIMKFFLNFKILISMNLFLFLFLLILIIYSYYNYTMMIKIYFLLIIFTLLLNYYILNNYITTTNNILIKWLDLDYIYIEIAFRYSTESILLALTTIILTYYILLYSLKYMEHDKDRKRFLLLIVFFIMFMSIIVFSSNLITFFIGWEGIGVCSFLLISFWSHRSLAAKAAMKAILVNRVGDIAFLAATIIYFNYNGSVYFLNINNIIILNETNINLIIILFMIAASCKSAQLIAHTWLTDAMEGPTPVSALIHAATLVTAGIILLLRFINPILNMELDILLYLGLFGAATAFLAGFAGSFHVDSKKIIALSTVSQLGYLVESFLTTSDFTTIAHLIIHAFFKALLFLTTGELIHNYLEQDLRLISTTNLNDTFLNLISFSGSLSLMGVEFTSGMYSKEEILFKNLYLFDFNSFLLNFILLFSLFGAFFTINYSSNFLFNVTTTESEKNYLYYIYEDLSSNTTLFELFSTLGLISFGIIYFIII